MCGRMPLSNVKVIDATQVVAGPVCGAYLSDFGADLIKLESPTGDISRSGRRKLNGHSVSPTYERLNRNKRSIVINLKTEKGRHVAYDLVESADVFLQNWQPGVAERLSVDYETLAEHNEDLIYVQISGYGETGPAAHQRAFDTAIQHLSGLSSLMGYEGHPPVRAQSSLSDFYAGTNAALATLAALRHRDQGHGGQKVSISMLDSLIHNMDSAFEFYLNFDEEFGRSGSTIFSRPGSFPTAMETTDGYISVSSFLHSNRLWEGLCELLDRRDLLDGSNYKSADSRAKEASSIRDILEDWVSTKSSEEALDGLRNVGIPVAPHNSVSEAANWEQVQHRDVFEEVEHPRLGSFVMTKPPFQFSESPVKIRATAPALGEHTSDVLLEAGYTMDEIEVLEEANAISTYDT